MSRPIFGSVQGLLFILLNVVLGLVLVYRAFKMNIPLARYLVIGTLGFIILAGLSMVSEILQVDIFGVHRADYFNMAFIFEFLLFTLGLAQKTALESKEKLIIQEELTRSLMNTAAIQLELKNQLEADLQKAKLEIILEQELKSKSQLELIEKETQLEVMLHQMNPHFIFNSLNSLKAFIVKNQTKEALSHIDGFSQLLRNFLDFSRVKKVSVQEVIHNIQLYIELESKRLPKPISLVVHVADDIEPEFDEIPALLVQPFVENALFHGLPYEEINSPTIRLDFYQDEIFMYIEITDNGIGRKAAGQRRKLTDHIGMATSNAEKRISIINKGLNGLTIEDLHSDDETPCGTRVNIRIQRN